LELQVWTHGDGHEDKDLFSLKLPKHLSKVPWIRNTHIALEYTTLHLYLKMFRKNSDPHSEEECSVAVLWG